MNLIFRPPVRRFFVALVLVLTGVNLLFGAVPSAHAASEGRRVFANSLKKMPVVAGRAVAAVTASADEGAAVEFQVSLKMRDFPKLLDRLAKGERPAQAEMAARYYPRAADVAKVADWAATQGLTVVGTEPNNLGVQLRGTVAQVRTALRTTFSRVAFEGKEYTAAQAAPSLPASVATAVLGINGLQPYLHATKHRVKMTDAAALPQVANQPPYYVKEILHAYDADNTGYTGANQKIAILIDTFPLDTDLTQFWQANGIPQTLGNIEKVNVTNATTLPVPEGEETLDVSWSSGIAPGAKVRIYATSDLSFSSLDKGLQRIITDLPSQPTLRQLSISLGQGELFLSESEVLTQSQYFATITSFGVSIFISTGDGGSMPDESGDFPNTGPLQASYGSTDPNVTAVGGTTLVLDPSSGEVDGETAWADTGGGASIFFTRPAYQAGTGVPAGTRRLVPDVASAADPEFGCYLVLGGKVKQFGGTSWSAPTWAGFAALMNEARADGQLPSLGLLNTLIYPLIGTANFRDVVTGSNGPDGSNLYNAGPGFDETTGIGVPDVGVLLQTLSSGGGSDVLSISGFTPSSGAAGTAVVINGGLLGSVSSVSFGGVTASFTIVSNTQITATVPAGATPGPVTITLADDLGDTVAGATSFTVLPSAAANDAFENASPITTTVASIAGSNVSATKQNGEPDHAGNAAGASVWYVWTAPASGIYALGTFGSNFDTLLAVYTGAAVNALTEVASSDDANVGVASSLTFSATAGTVYHFAVDGYNDGTGPAEGNFVLNLTPSLSGPTISDFTPTSGNTGTVVIITGTGFTGTNSVTFNGTTAAFTVNSDKQITAIVPANATTGVIQVTDGADRTVTSTEFFVVLPSPANDNFASALPLGGTSAIAQGSNVGATKEAGEPDHAGNRGGASVWYVWTAPAAGVYTASTAGSSFDTLLAVYTGTAVNALAEVGSNDDTGGLITSSVTFAATAGTVYHIAVDGFNGDIGAINFSLASSSGQPALVAFAPASGGAGVTVTITGTNLIGASAVSFAGTPAASFSVINATRITAVVPANASSGPITVVTPNGTATSATAFTALGAPPNDNFANSQVLTGATPIAVTGTNGGASKETGEPDHAGKAGGRSVWYTWTAASNSDYTITTRSSDFDTLLAVYTGNTVSTLTAVASNDDDPAGGSTSAVTFTAQAGKTYRIAVDGFNGEAGDLTLSVLQTGSSTSLYATGFEVSEGFDSYLTGETLVGQQGWLARAGDGGNGLDTEDGVTQVAYIGFSPPSFGTASTQIYHPLNFAPNGQQTVVTFTTSMNIIDSDNGFFDQFGYTVYNVAGQPLFALIFDTNSDQVFYQLDNGQGLAAAGSSFTPGVDYDLKMTLDYANNVWSATLNNNPIVVGQPITTAGAGLSLGDIDVTWNLTDPFNPGDDYMFFDDFAAVAVVAQAPMITVQPRSQTVAVGSNVSFSVVAAGGQPLGYQWNFNGAPINGATGPTYGVANVQAANTGAYTVTVSNSFGAVTSSAATLTVTPGATSQQTPAVAVVARQGLASSATGAKALLVLSRSGDTTSPLTVNYKIKGSARANVDYRALSGNATFLPGQATIKLKIKALGTAATSATPTKLKVTLAAGAGYTVSDPSRAKITIVHVR